jgi:hypothetical protein
MKYVCRRREIHTRFELENLKKRKLGRRKHKWLHNYKMEFKVTGWNGMD